MVVLAIAAHHHHLLFVHTVAAAVIDQQVSRSAADPHFAPRRDSKRTAVASEARPGWTIAAVETCLSQSKKGNGRAEVGRVHLNLPTQASGNGNGRRWGRLGGTGPPSSNVTLAVDEASEGVVCDDRKNALETESFA